MIVADTSAFMAILLSEPDADRYTAALHDAERVLVGAPTAFELRLALQRKGGAAAAAGADLVLQHPVEVVDWTAEHVSIATEALRRFGGRQAQLNFGDCLTYAIAKSLGLPLLYKGEDFAATDIPSALEA